MTSPSDPRHAGQGLPPAGPSTRELPLVRPDQTEPPAGSTAAGPGRGATLPAPGQLPPQPVAPQQEPVGAQPVVPPPAAPSPAWPDAAADQPSPPTRPATVLDGVQPTGPVDFVPGLPGTGQPAPAPEPRRKRARGDRSTLVAAALAALAVVLLQLGLVDDDADLWSRVTLWAVFATAATVLGLITLGVHAAGRLAAALTTRLVAGAVLALAVFWLLVVLPIVASDPGFLVTAALLALGGALWLGPGRDR